MHSRIIQMETKPVKHTLSSDSFDDHWFTTSIADYVWLPVEWEDGRPVLRWRDEWRP